MHPRSSSMGMHTAKNAASSSARTAPPRPPPPPPPPPSSSTQDADAAPPITTTSGGGRPFTPSSLFSRLGLPSLRSRTRNLADFHIRPADPHRKYWPGDHVNGAVILTIVKPIRIVHLTVTLYGFARVFRTGGPTANELTPGPAAINASPVKAFKYHGNGLLSLFQDEQVLSGEGRLEPGKYEFGFDLVFPPGKLPSSIDFERGTISYIISATLTRPTSISATTNCDRKVYLQERVDVGLLPPPLARTITLEPIPKKARKKKTVPVEKTNGGGSATSSDPPEPASDLDSIRATENSGDSSVNFEETQHEFAVGNTPRSPVQSDVRSDASGESAVSGSTGRSGRGPNATADQSNVVTVQTATGKAPTAEKSITATISVPKGGYLPGDVVTVKINVQHRKVVKSMHGVIVTFYRQGRIDYDPPLAAFKRTGDDGKDEYWPRSKTGLGGLSLSSAGSFSVFRKDLSQSISPLIIDPATLTANINASVRVPQDTFSTIEGLPGEMLSFKYHVEVIVDLGGKLANQFIQGGNVKRLGMSGGVTKGIPDESDPGQISAWGGKMIDTDQLRREKGVVAVSFDITIGTVDSTRVRGKAPVWPTHPSLSQHMYDGPGRDGLPHAAGRGNGFHDLAAEDLSPQPPEAPAQPAQVAQPAQPYYPSSPTLMMSRFNLSGSFPAPQYIPPPQLPDESTLTEKERIRLAEERLLPSQPPPAPTATGTTAMAGPSAPPLSPTDDNIYDAEDATSLSNGPSLEPSAPPFPLPPADGAPGGIGVGPHATAPTLDAIAFSESAVNHATDDKQELERQRLLAEASAPPEFPDDYDDGAGQPSTSVTGGPSAPPLDAVDPSAAPSAPAPYDDDDGVNLPPSAPYEIDDSVHYGPQYSYQAAMPGPSSPSGPSSPHHPSTSGVLPPPEPLPKYEK